MKPAIQARTAMMGMVAGLVYAPELMAQGQPVVGSALTPDWLTVTWMALVTALVLGIALRLSIKTLSALRLITQQAARRARRQTRVLVGALVLLAMVFPYVVRQQPALALLLLLGMGMAAAAGGESEGQEGAVSGPTQR
jgi:phosphatidylserine synthase